VFVTFRAVRESVLPFALAALCIVLSPCPSSAADDASGAVTISPLIVSANPVPTSAAEVASSVSLVTADEMEAEQARTLPDVLAALPGLNLVQTGGPGGVTSLFIRGTDSNHAKVLIDGVDVSDPSTPTGAFDFASLLTAGFERVEVLRGPQSGLYGSDAIGGVVDIVTLAGAGPPRVAASVEAGSFATFDQSGSAAGSLGAFSYRFDVGHVHVGATPVTPLELLAPGEIRRDDQYDNLTLATKLGLSVGPGGDLWLTARYVDSFLRFTGDDNFGPFPDPVQSENRGRELFARASWRRSLFAGRFDETLGLGYTSYWREGLTPGFASSVEDGDRVKIHWRGDVDLGAGEILALGAEHQVDAIRRSPVSATMATTAGSIQLQSAVGGLFFGAASLRYDSNDRFGGAFTYRVAPAFLIAATGTKLKASLGAGFKAPTLNELFVSFPQFGFFANPHLQPERSLGWDAGIEQALAGGRFTLGATMFENRIRDLITANADFTTEINVGRATTKGVESSIAWRASDRLAFRADYTYTDARDDIARQELVRRPKNKASIQARWRAMRALELTATALWVGPWIDGSRDFSIPRLRAPGYTTIDVAASYALARGLTLFGRITNLTDSRYQDPFGFQRPRVGAFMGVKGGF
jgi:vitamin B12 transporter